MTLWVGARWINRAATGAEVSGKELELIRETDPAIGYNLSPRWPSRPKRSSRLLYCHVVMAALIVGRLCVTGSAPTFCPHFAHSYR